MNIGSSVLRSGDSLRSLARYTLMIEAERYAGVALLLSLYELLLGKDYDYCCDM